MQTFEKFFQESAGSGADDVVRRALRTVRSHLGMDIAYLSEFVDGRLVFRAIEAEDGVSPVGEGDSMPLSEVYCQHILEGRLPQIMTDLSREPLAASLAVTAAVPVGSHVSVPIRRTDGSVYGMFCCLSRTPNETLNQRDLNVMEMFADLSADRIHGVMADQLREDEVRARLEAAMAPGGLDMVFQPIFELGADRASGFEALARFLHEPYRSPDVWFAEAARAGRGVDLEIAAMEAALPALRTLPDDVYLSVNAAPETIASGRLMEVFAPWPPERIALEITEHALAASGERLLEEIAHLRFRGVQLAIDDAGAGFAGLSQIVRLSPDIIKLDRSLVTGIDAHPVRRSLATALVHFAAECSATLVAEGIETEAELATLRELRVPRGQGWLLGRPAPLELARGYAVPPRAAGRSVA